MPHVVRHRPTKGPKGNYAIVKKLPGGRTKTVARSTTERKAKMSAGMRDSDEAKR